MLIFFPFAWQRRENLAMMKHLRFHLVFNGSRARFTHISARGDRAARGNFYAMNKPFAVRLHFHADQ